MKPKHLQIEKIEKLYRVKVLYACEAGSRSWGLESPYSDNDLGLIYYRPQEWYISILEKSDAIDLAGQTDYDGFGWDLKKFLQGLLNSNAILFDWLQSNKQYVAYPFTIKKLETISQQYFDGRKGNMNLPVHRSTSR
ncbi:MAG: putative nucleotidyltransferase [Polaribacter sp.]|jgi:predicted nucleotidyltransferase